MDDYGLDVAFSKQAISQDQVIVLLYPETRLVGFKATITYQFS